MKTKNNMIKKFIQSRIFLFAVSLSSLSTFAQQKQEKTKPNVIMIIFDDLRDHESLTPFKVHTPNFNRLAERGIRLDRAYCQFPVCNSSRASILSGLRPPTTKVVQNTKRDYKLSSDVITLPQTLRNNGYYTVSIGKVLHNNAGDKRSWDMDLEYKKKYKDPINHEKRGKYNNDPNFIKLNGKSREYAYKGPEDLDAYGYTDHLVASDVEQFLDKVVKKNQPFFLAAGFKKPHNPYIGPSSYFDLYPTDKMKLIEEPKDLIPPYHWATPKASREKFNAMNTNQRKKFMAAYAAVTTFSDSQMGRLLDKMDEYNLWENTIVICFGDHGYHLGEHNNHWGKVTLYEQSARVPMIFYAPDIKTNGQRTKNIVELIDIFPTIADYLNIKTPKNLEGESFKALVENPTIPWDNEAFIYEGNNVNNLQYSIVSNRYRYTVWADRNPVKYELYDHSKDPGEYYNLIKDMSLEEIKKSKYATVVAEMEDRKANPSNPNQIK